MIDSVLEDLHEGLADRSQSLQGVSIDWFFEVLGRMVSGVWSMRYFERTT
jgi:hypothetical protein